VFALFVVLTVAEIVLVLAVLASYLLLVRQSLRRTSKTLGKVAFGVRAIETQAGTVGPSVGRLNAALEALAGAVPGLVSHTDRAGRT
jgi:hypothetical protein